MNALLAETAQAPEVSFLAMNFVVLALITALLWLHQSIVAKSVQKELLKLHTKRISLIREALATSAENAWNVPTEIRYPFESWVKFTSEGVIVAGQVFSPEAKFAVVARDVRNIARATITADGGGNVIIESHGLFFHAHRVMGAWSIEQIQKPK